MVEQGERVSEVKAYSFLVFIVCHNEETGNTTQRVFCVCVCVFVCVCARVGGMLALRQASRLDVRPLPHFWQNLVQVHEFLKMIAG